MYGGQPIPQPIPPVTGGGTGGMLEGEGLNKLREKRIKEDEEEWLLFIKCFLMHKS